MINRPTVSIGLYVFNGEQFLERSVNSLLCQSFSDFELIISDNCSTDRTEEICRSFAARDIRVRYYRNPKNMGAGWNTRRVFELAEGKYFKWAAHDDMCEPTFLEQCVKALDSDPGFVLAYPRTRVVDENGIFIEDYDCALRTNEPDPLSRIEDLILIGHRCYQIFGLFRTDVLRMLPPMPSHAHADRLLLVRVGLTGRFQEIPDYLFINTKHANQSVWTVPQRVKRRGFRLTTHSGTLPALEWWDPSKNRKIHLPEWTLLLKYAGSIMSSGLRLSQKLRAFRILLRWMVKYRRRLAKDIVIALDQLLYNLQNPRMTSRHLKST